MPGRSLGARGRRDRRPPDEPGEWFQNLVHTPAPTCLPAAPAWGWGGHTGSRVQSVSLGTRGGAWAGTQRAVPCPQAGATPQAAAAHGQLRPGAAVRRGGAHPAAGLLLGGDPGEPLPRPPASLARRREGPPAAGTEDQPEAPPAPPRPCPSRPAIRSLLDGAGERPPAGTWDQNRERQQVFARGAEAASRSRSQFADGALTNQLARLLLERSDSLYQVPGYEPRVHQ